MPSAVEGSCKCNYTNQLSGVIKVFLVQRDGKPKISLVSLGFLSLRLITPPLYKSTHYQKSLSAEGQISLEGKGAIKDQHLDSNYQNLGFLILQIVKYFSFSFFFPIHLHHTSPSFSFPSKWRVIMMHGIASNYQLFASYSLNQLYDRTAMGFAHCPDGQNISHWMI